MSDLVTIQVTAKRPKKMSQQCWKPVYFNSLANSNRWSEQSCTRITRVPTCWTFKVETSKGQFLITLVKWAVQERAMRAMVVLWWMNISQKSFRCTSKNWLQRYHLSCHFI